VENPTIVTDAINGLTAHTLMAWLSVVNTTSRQKGYKKPS
jgi:hypothetical protein